MTHTLAILRNPRARHAPTEDALLLAAQPLRNRGWAVTVETPRDNMHTVARARAAAERGVEAVAACGGDGTVHAVANGLAGSATALAVLPTGTTNIWAREAGIPRALPAALALLPHARRLRVDLGRAHLGGTERRFLLMCGVGLDADIVQRVEGSRGKRLLGRGWYAAAGAVALARARPGQATIELDDTRRVVPLLQLVAGNTRLYGGVARITGDARATDGLLDVCILAGQARTDTPRLALQALRGALHRRHVRGAEYLRTARVTIDASPARGVQLDGEYAGTTPVRIEVDRAALDVLVAPGARALFGD